MIMDDMWKEELQGKILSSQMGFELKTFDFRKLVADALTTELLRTLAIRMCFGFDLH